MIGGLNYSLAQANADLQASRDRDNAKQAEALQQWNDVRAGKRKARSEKMKAYWAERKAREANTPVSRDPT